jgi:hypothetical protein
MDNRTIARVVIGTFTGEGVRAIPELTRSEALSRFLADQRFTASDFNIGLRAAVAAGWITEEGTFIRLTNLGLAERPAPNGTSK